MATDFPRASRLSENHNLLPPLPAAHSLEESRSVLGQARGYLFAESPEFWRGDAGRRGAGQIRV